MLSQTSRCIELSQHRHEWIDCSTLMAKHNYSTISSKVTISLLRLSHSMSWIGTLCNERELAAIVSIVLLQNADRGALNSRPLVTNVCNWASPDYRGLHAQRHSFHKSIGEYQGQKTVHLKFTAGKKVPSVLITDKYTSIFLVSQLRWVKEVNGKHSYSNKGRIFKDHS